MRLKTKEKINDEKFGNPKNSWLNLFSEMTKYFIYYL